MGGPAEAPGRREKLQKSQERAEAMHTSLWMERECTAWCQGRGRWTKRKMSLPRDFTAQTRTTSGQMRNTQVLGVFHQLLRKEERQERGGELCVGGPGVLSLVFPLITYLVLDKGPFLL